MALLLLSKARKSKEEGEIGSKSRDEGDLPSYSSHLQNVAVKRKETRSRPNPSRCSRPNFVSCVLLSSVFFFLFAAETRAKWTVSSLLFPHTTSISLFSEISSLESMN